VKLVPLFITAPWSKLDLADASLLPDGRKPFLPAGLFFFLLLLSFYQIRPDFSSRRRRCDVYSTKTRFTIHFLLHENLLLVRISHSQVREIIYLDNSFFEAQRLQRVFVLSFPSSVRRFKWNRIFEPMITRAKRVFLKRAELPPFTKRVLMKAPSTWIILLCSEDA